MNRAAEDSNSSFFDKGYFVEKFTAYHQLQKITAIHQVFLQHPAHINHRNPRCVFRQ